MALRHLMSLRRRGDAASAFLLTILRSRLFSVVTALALLPVVSVAQEGPTFILKAGAVSAKQNMSELNFGFPGFATEYRWGIAAGGELRLLRVAGIDLLAELLYVQKGYSAIFPVTTAEFPDGTGAFISLPYRLHYLTLAGSAKCRLLSGPVAPYVRAGTRADILLDSSEGLEYHSVNLGVTIGIGAELAVGPLPVLLLEGRFSPDFTDARGPSLASVKNRSFELLAGVGF
jgi:hypothetical protein